MNVKIFITLNLLFFNQIMLGSLLTTLKNKFFFNFISSTINQKKISTINMTNDSIFQPAIDLPVENVIDMNEILTSNTINTQTNFFDNVTQIKLPQLPLNIPNLLPKIKMPSNFPTLNVNFENIALGVALATIPIIFFFLLKKSKHTKQKFKFIIKIDDEVENTAEVFV